MQRPSDPEASRPALKGFVFAQGDDADARAVAVALGLRFVDKMSTDLGDLRLIARHRVVEDSRVVLTAPVEARLDIMSPQAILQLVSGLPLW